MKEDWCDSVNSVNKWNPDRGTGFTYVFFGAAATLFRVLSTTLEHSLLIQCLVSLGGSSIILCNSCRHICKYLEIPEWAHLEVMYDGWGL